MNRNRFRKCFSVLTLIVFIEGFTVLGGPTLTVTPEVYDFGDQEINTGAFDYEFVVTNSGDELLRILRVRPDCGCTTAELAETEILPGGEVTISGTVKTLGREGSFKKGLLVSSNDSDRPQVYLPIKISLPATPRNEGIFLKRRVVQGRARKEGTGSARFLLSNRVETCTVNIVGPEGWRVTGRGRFSLTTGSNFVISIGGPLLAAFDEAEVPVYFRTDHPDYPEVEGTIKFPKFDPELLELLNPGEEESEAPAEEPETVEGESAVDGADRGLDVDLKGIITEKGGIGDGSGNGNSAVSEPGSDIVNRMENDRVKSTVKGTIIPVESDNSSLDLSDSDERDREGVKVEAILNAGDDDRPILSIENTSPAAIPVDEQSDVEDKSTIGVDIPLESDDDSPPVEINADGE